MPSPDASKNWVAKKSSEYSPIFAASWRTGQGVCSRSSHSAAAGRITSAANSCTQSRISRRSLLSSRENPGVGSLMLPNSNMSSGARKPKLRVLKEKFIPNDFALRLSRPSDFRPARGAPALLAVIPCGQVYPPGYAFGCRHSDTKGTSTRQPEAGAERFLLLST